MLPVVEIGPLAVQTPGLLLPAGVWLATWLLDREGPRLGLPAEALNRTVLVGLVCGVLGARLGYAVRYLDVYLDSPLGLLSLNPTTLAIEEGVLAGVGVAVIYGARKRLPLWPTLDAMTPGLAAFALAAGFSRLASGDGFGAPADLPWAIALWGARRHPSQIYELLAAGLVLWAIWEMRLRAPFAGFTFLAYMAMATTSRIFLEAFRGDSVILLGMLRSAQLIGLAMLGASLVGLHLRARGRAATDRPSLER